MTPANFLASLKAAAALRIAAGEHSEDVAWDVVCVRTNRLGLRRMEALAHAAFPKLTLDQILNEHADQPASDGAIYQNALMAYVRGEAEGA